MIDCQRAHKMMPNLTFSLEPNYFSRLHVSYRHQSKMCNMRQTDTPKPHTECKTAVKDRDHGTRSPLAPMALALLAP